MEYGAEEVWRKGLQARGKEWVLSELRRRPGQPEDVLYDVVFKEPYPTRAFCFQWCAEEENRVFRMSWHTYATIIAMVLLIVSILKGIECLERRDCLPADAPGADDGGYEWGWGWGWGWERQWRWECEREWEWEWEWRWSGSTLDIPSMLTSPSTIVTSSGSTLSSPGTTVSGSGTASSTTPGSVTTSPSGSTLTTGLPSPSSICGYITYDLPRCPQQH